MSTGVGDRLDFVQRDTARLRERLSDEVRRGLAAPRKRLPCCLFYDREGSRLFEAICRLPEYYLTRAERAILERHAADVVQRCGGVASLIELGSGNSEKTCLLIEALLARQRSLEYVPVDICSDVLRETAVTLLARYPALHVTAVAAEYADALAAIGPAGPGERRLVLWLGSNVGNLTRPEAAVFLRGVRRGMGGEDALLMGVDRRKDRATLEAAYEDAVGLTAEFNMNILVRLNRDWAAGFDLDAFEHRAVYDEVEGRIEMHLVSRCTQQVEIGALGLHVALSEGETIHTENSYKYSDAEIDALLEHAGLARETWWLDPDERFRLVLARPGR